MEEVVKNKVIVILLILSIIFFLLWVGSSASVGKQKTLAANKAALSMELEEKNLKLEKEKASLSSELDKAGRQLAEEKSASEAVKKELSQEQVANQAFKVELERVTRIKESLEKQKQESLDALPVEAVEEQVK